MKWFGIRFRGEDQPDSRRARGEGAPRGSSRQGEELETAVVEVSKALQIKRWETNEDKPFKGFGSYPGRF